MTERMFGGYVKTMCLNCGCTIEAHRETMAAWDVEA